MQSPCVLAVHRFVEQHVLVEECAAVDTGRLAQLEAALPAREALSADDIVTLQSESLRVWNRAVAFRNSEHSDNASDKEVDGSSNSSSSASPFTKQLQCLRHAHLLNMPHTLDHKAMRARLCEQ